jgi:SAM-dependent methyltransferase
MAEVGGDRLDRERQFHNIRFTDENRIEQSKFYWALKDLERWYGEAVHDAAAGADVLEYGCAKGEWSLDIAKSARHVTGIDISDVAIAAASASASADSDGIKNCHFLVMNAEELTFEDNSFDVVFGSGILHHLDVEKCYREIARVLRPGGIAIFKEPLGHNPLINLYRDKTPEARTPDEHPFLKSDIAAAKARFATVDVKFYGLATLGAVPFRDQSIGEFAWRAASMVDRVLAGVPGVRWQFWYASIVLMK